MAVVFDTGAVAPVTLPDLVIAERFVPQKVVAETAWTKGGKQIRWERALKSVPLTLYGEGDWGWMTVAQLTAMQAYADVVNPSTPYVLSHNSINYNVLWRFEDSPVISHDPLVKCVQGPAYYRNVVLKFMWVLP